MIKINMGCGWRNFGSDWIHIDGGDYDHLDYNSINPLEFADNEVDLIYASHVIEYFDREEVLDLLTEWNRALKRGGILRVAAPNFREIARLYHEGKYDLGAFLGLLYGKMPMDEQTIYHKTAYDFESLSDILKACGFRNVNFYEWRETEHAAFDDHSQAYLPHMDKEVGVLMSLNVEGVK